MKTVFDYLLCCKSSPNDSSVITLNSNPANERTKDKTMRETEAMFLDNPNTTTNTNANANANNHNTQSNNNTFNVPSNNSINNSNSFISCQSQFLSHSKVNPNDISFVTVENIHVKESNFSLPEIDTELLIGKELKVTGDLFWNKELIIDRLGIKSIKRKKMLNSESVFGFSQEVKDKYGRPVNDFVLNYPFDKEATLESSLFSIKYLKSEEMYEMTMLNSNLNILHLIDYSYFFDSKSEQRFLIGKIYVEIKIDDDEKQKQNDWKISVVIKDEKEKDTKYSFKKNEIPIVIGRVNATITIASNSISKSHAIIDYSEEMEMYFIQDMGSTNKTYKILSKGDKLMMRNEMKFKVGETKYEIREFDPK